MLGCLPAERSACIERRMSEFSFVLFVIGLFEMDAAKLEWIGFDACLIILMSELGGIVKVANPILLTLPCQKLWELLWKVLLRIVDYCHSYCLDLRWNGTMP